MKHKMCKGLLWSKSLSITRSSHLKASTTRSPSRKAQRKQTWVPTVDPMRLVCSAHSSSCQITTSSPRVLQALTGFFNGKSWLGCLVSQQMVQFGQKMPTEAVVAFNEELSVITVGSVHNISIWYGWKSHPLRISSVWLPLINTMLRAATIRSLTGSHAKNLPSSP